MYSESFIRLNAFMPLRFIFAISGFLRLGHEFIAFSIKGLLKIPLGCEALVAGVCFLSSASKGSLFFSEGNPFEEVENAAAQNADDQTFEQICKDNGTCGKGPKPSLLGMGFKLTNHGWEIKEFNSCEHEDRGQDC